MELLDKVKKNLILQHDEDDALLQSYIAAAVAYAEGFQKKALGCYSIEASMTPATKQAVIMLASLFYESRDGGTGGFFADSAQAARQAWATVDMLLRLDKDWQV